MVELQGFKRWEAKLYRNGNSLVVTFPDYLVKTYDYHEGDTVELWIRGD